MHVKGLSQSTITQCIAKVTDRSSVTKLLCFLVHCSYSPTNTLPFFLVNCSHPPTNRHCAARSMQPISDLTRSASTCVHAFNSSLDSVQALCNLKIALLRLHWLQCTISRLARIFRILKMRNTISRLRIFPNCTEHLYAPLCWR